MASSLLAAFLAVVPVFCLILAGLAAGRTGVLGQNASDVLSRFVVWLALPAMLFDTVAGAKWADLWQPGFIIAFGVSGLSMLALATAVSCFQHGRPLTDAAIEGLNAGYPNVGFMGFPIAATALGPAALLPTTLATIMTVCVLFASAIILVEIGSHTGSQHTGSQSGKSAGSPDSGVHVGQILLKVAKSLIRNPLILSPVCGIPFAWLGVGMPAPVDHFLHILAGAASPCALVAIGVFLVGNRAHAGQARTAPFLVLCKLVAQPFLAWLLAYKLFPIEPIAAKTAVVMAALPTGTGAFMLADYYKRDARITSQVILISTLLSLASVSLVIALLA